MLINGDSAGRLGKKVCKRPGAKLATLLSGDELYYIGDRAEPFESPWASTFLCTFHRAPYIQDRDARKCKVGDCFRNGISLTLHGAQTMMCQRHIEEALVSMTNRHCNADADNMPNLREPPTALPASSSRRPGQDSLLYGTGASSVEDSAALIDSLHRQDSQQNVFAPACWPAATCLDYGVSSLPAKPSLSKSGVVDYLLVSNTPRMTSIQPPGINLYGQVVDLTGPSADRLLLSRNRREDPDLNQLMPSIVRRPREGAQPDTYPFETPSFARPQIASDTAELIMERTGGNVTKEVDIERFQEFGVLALRGFGSFSTVVGTGCYGAELEPALRRQSSTR